MAAQRPEEEQEEKGFVVSDKRLFTSAGERRADTSEAATPLQSAPPPPPQAPPRVEEPPRRPAASGAPPRGELPPADFSTFVAMLANNVMLFLGQIPDPATQQPRLDLQQAQHTINMLIMLREKTRGNLTPEEEQLLQEVLPQLQMAFVNVRQQVG